MTGDADAELLMREELDFPETGRIVRIRVWRIPESDAYPSGVKYSFHYGDKQGNTILRYDNSHADTKGHKRHTASGLDDDYDFPGDYRSLLQRFRNEVTTHEQD